MYSCTSKARVKLRTVTATRPRVEGDLRSLGGAVFLGHVTALPICTYLVGGGQPSGSHVWPINCFAPLAINASVHDSLSVARITLRMRLPFAHNDVCAFHAARHILWDEYAVLKGSKSTLFVTLEPTACEAWMGPSLRFA